MMNEELIKVTPKSSLETTLHVLNTDSKPSLKCRWLQDGQNFLG